MLKFIRDMLIGWIIYTDSGKQTANKIVNYAYTQIKKNINTPNVDDKKKNVRNNNVKQYDNRTANQRDTQNTHNK